MTKFKAPKLYAVTINGKLRGTLRAVVSSGQLSAAGAVALNGAPVNVTTAQLSLNDGLIQKALCDESLPTWDLRTHNGKDFITAWYDRESGGYNND